MASKRESIQVGMRFGRLTVIEQLPQRGIHKMWRCQCDCGNIKDVYDTNLKRGKTKSCGCLVKDVNSTHGDYASRLYHVWAGMLDRCNTHNTRSKNHGDRGIRVCDEWHDFEAFKSWAVANGYDENAPRGKCTLDRIDNNGNYEPSNCRWVSNTRQCRNKRNNRLLTFNGEIHCLTEWGEILGINPKTIDTRLRKGWSVNDALNKPLMHN